MNGPELYERVFSTRVLNNSTKDEWFVPNNVHREMRRVPVPYLRLHAINEHPVHRVKTGRKRV
jgi:hypothetical protein